MPIVPSAGDGGGVWTIGSVRRYWKRLKARRSGVPAVVDAEIDSEVSLF
jgi:hypothetical protein